MTPTYRRYKQEHRCGRCGTQLPEWYAHTYCQKCLEIKRQDNRRRRQALREKNGKPCRKPVLSPGEIKEAREIYEWLKSLRDSETCRQAISEGRHVNIQMRYLKAAWEAHKRERGHSNGRECGEPSSALSAGERHGGDRHYKGSIRR